MDGVAFDGGTASAQQLELGAGGYIDGFEDGIVGHSAGETFDINTTFPDPYQNNPDLSGKDAVFTITLSKIEEVTLPEMNDEFVTMVKGEDTTVEQYTKEIRGTLESQAVVQNQSDKKSVIMDELMKHVELLKYPKDKVQKYKDQMTEQYQQIATSLNMGCGFWSSIWEWTRILLRSWIRRSKYVKQQKVLDLIAKEEKITISENEISEWLDENAQAQQMTVDDLKSQYSEDEIKDQALANKVISWLWDKAEVTKSDSAKE